MRVVLDPGHFAGHNRGVVGGYTEGARMWEYALLLRDAFEARGCTVALTKASADENPTLSARGKRAAGADLFVSCHSNAAAQAAAGGISVFRSVARPGDAELAARLSAGLAKVMGVRDRGPCIREGKAGRDYYTVIDAAARSGCAHVLLVEHGFHTNPKECSWLCDDGNLRALADAEAGILSGAEPSASASKTAVVARGGLTEGDLEAIAHTVAGEARGEIYKGQIAVAQCVHDRLFDPKKRFGRTLAQVIDQTQFSGSGWVGDANHFPQVMRAVREVFVAGGRVFPEACLWFLSQRASRLYGARDAMYKRLGTIGGHTFWGDVLAVSVTPGNNLAGDTPTLKPGMRGDAVRRVQELLGVSADGIFGAVTRRAVISFQASSGLKPDGIVGVKTWAALLK